MMLCVNLCEIINQKTVSQRILNKIFEKNEYIERVYIGSYFCGQYFLKMSWADNIIEICKNKELNITLVIPVFTEKDLNTAKEKIIGMYEKYSYIIDEITVNDFGMLNYVYKNIDGIKINLGRLFFKDARDPRVPQYYNSKLKPSGSVQKYCEKYNIYCCEIDETNVHLDLEDLKNDCKVAIHTPLCYMTTGNICKFASIHQAIEKKYRPNGKCQMECQAIYEHYKEKVNGDIVDMYRIGRTVYFYKEKRTVTNPDADRNIYNPFFDLIDIPKKEMAQ